MDIDQLEAAAGVATTATGGMHLGRGARLASAAQRLALYARDRGCTRPGPADPP